ncbi:transposase [Streptomyces sp. G44]|nr:transposase [Streptomyces sp. G44]
MSRVRPSFRSRPQGGDTAPIYQRAVFTAIVYVLISGCAWRYLPPTFGVSSATAHRRFTLFQGGAEFVERECECDVDGADGRGQEFFVLGVREGGQDEAAAGAEDVLHHGGGLRASVPLDPLLGGPPRAVCRRRAGVGPATAAL